MSTSPLVTFWVAGKPVAQPRWKSRQDRRPCDAWRELIGWRAKTAMAGRKAFTGPLWVEMLFILPVPESATKKEAATLYGQPHTSRPDTDNLGKPLDCLNKLVWSDDALHSTVLARKRYQRSGEQTGVQVSVFRDDPALPVALRGVPW